MKGNISLKDFIHQVRDELRDAQDSSGDPFYQLKTVQLEVTFALEASGGGKAKLYVVELGGKASATQTHKVTLMLTPVLKGSKKKGPTYKLK